MVALTMRELLLLSRCFNDRAPARIWLYMRVKSRFDHQVSETLNSCLFFFSYHTIVPFIHLSFCLLKSIDVIICLFVTRKAWQSTASATTAATSSTAQTS